jgi:hypothetical protein
VRDAFDPRKTFVSTTTQAVADPPAATRKERDA